MIGIIQKLEIASHVRELVYLRSWMIGYRLQRGGMSTIVAVRIAPILAKISVTLSVGRLIVKRLLQTSERGQEGGEE